MLKLTPQEAEVILSDVPQEKTFKLHQSANDQLQWLNTLVKPA